MEFRCSFLLVIWIIVFKCIPSGSIFLVIPEDVPTGLAAVYGFFPKIIQGNDHRFGFGFRLGNHADFQVLYELGPQTITKPIQPLRVRSASYRQRVVQRRRPILDLLIALGLVKESSYEFNVVHDDEPR